MDSLANIWFCRLLEIGHTVIEIDKTEGHDLTDMRCLHNIESVDYHFSFGCKSICT
jgi:hypothetical protein